MKNVKIFVMDAKSDPKVVMDLSIFKNRWMEQSATQESKFVGGIIDENEPCLLIEILSRDPFFVTCTWNGTL